MLNVRSKAALEETTGQEDVLTLIDAACCADQMPSSCDA
jgi:hypothetical protein